MLNFTVDPGQKLGWAKFKDKKLVSWGNISSHEDTWLERIDDICEKMRIMIPRAAKVHCEWPRVMLGSARGHAAASRNDITKLGFLIGKLDAVIGPLNLMPVQEWKGQLSKIAVEYRVLKYFKLKKEQVRTDAIDALGIGQYLIQKGVIK